MTDHTNAANHPLVPMTVRIAEIKAETADIKTLRVTKDDGLPFPVKPGQLVMASLPGVGEAMFSATAGRDSLEISIKRTGILTEALHQLTPGRMLGLRGPYGNGFPVEAMAGKNLLFIAGGVGLAPVRSLIQHCIAQRSLFGSLQLICGARTPDDLAFREELTEAWPAVPDFAINLTVDKASSDWHGHVGFIPAFVQELQPSAVNTVCVLCGPPIMIQYTLAVLRDLGFEPENVYTTLEMRMKCGIGKCGRCNIGPCYVCLDGPVFSQAQLLSLPAEY